MHDWIAWLVTGIGVSLMVFLLGPIVIGTVNMVWELWSGILDDWAAAWRTLRRRE